MTASRIAWACGAVVWGAGFCLGAMGFVGGLVTGHSDILFYTAIVTAVCFWLMVVGIEKARGR